MALGAEWQKGIFLDDFKLVEFVNLRCLFIIGITQLVKVHIAVLCHCQEST